MQSPTRKRTTFYGHESECPVYYNRNFANNTNFPTQQSIENNNDVFAMKWPGLFITSAPGTGQSTCWPSKLRPTDDSLVTQTIKAIEWMVVILNRFAGPIQIKMIFEAIQTNDDVKRVIFWTGFFSFPLGYIMNFIIESFEEWASPMSGDS